MTDGAYRAAFETGALYRENLMAEAAQAAKIAQYYINTQTALSICMLADYAAEKALPDSVYETVLRAADGDYQPFEDDEGTSTIIDVAMVFAADNIHSPEEEEGYEHGGLISDSEFLNQASERAWLFYLAPALFTMLDLEPDGAISADVSTREEYILLVQNAEFSNNLLEAQKEVGACITAILKPLVDEMTDILKQRLDIRGDIKPHWFLSVIKAAQEAGEDIHTPLRAQRELTWFDKHWHQVVAAEQTKEAALLGRGDGVRSVVGRALN